MTHSQESQAGLLLLRDVPLPVPEFHVQLLQHLLQSLVHGEHGLPQTDFVAARQSAVSRAASATAVWPAPALQDLGCAGAQPGQVDMADGVFPVGLGAACWLWAGPASFGCCGPGLSMVGWRAPLALGGAAVFLCLAARESRGPSPYREQALWAVRAST